MDVIILNAIGGLLILISISVVSGKLIVRRALRKFIVPDLTQRGYRLDKVKVLSFLSKGQFKKEKLHLRPFTLGYPVHSRYLNLDYSSLENDRKNLQVTARVSVFLVFVYKVEYSHSL